VSTRRPSGQGAAQAVDEKLRRAALGRSLGPSLQRGVGALRDNSRGSAALDGVTHQPEDGSRRPPFDIVESRATRLEKPRSWLPDVP
jgi:hypothetical protein